MPGSGVAMRRKGGSVTTGTPAGVARFDRVHDTPVSRFTDERKRIV
jgi:hypothetical protein